jgi:hypothetical protein
LKGLFIGQWDALAITRTAVDGAPALSQHSAAAPVQHRAHLGDD